MISKINSFKPSFGIVTSRAKEQALKTSADSDKTAELIKHQQNNIPDIQIDYDGKFYNIYGVGYHYNDVRFLPWNTLNFEEACEIAEINQNKINE